jgi:CubicO group peptidase (beta-lactamase class C family)
MKTILLLAAALLAAAPAAAEISVRDIDRKLEKIVAGKGAGDPIAGAALAVFTGDRLVYAGAAGCADFEADGKTCARALAPEMKLRVASISKMALALGLKTLIDAGQVDPDRDVSDYLGWRLRNPSFPEQPITTRQLLSHTSSIRDPEAYWVDAPGKLQDLFNDSAAFAAADPASDRAPGKWFEYSNLNYGVLAGVIEGVTGERFDLFMQGALFAPLGLDAGYNWSGVPLEARRNGAALHRREEGLWRVSVDDAAMRVADPVPFRASEGLDRAAYLAGYKPGDNPTLFSPQGGLRASALDLGRIALQLKSADALTATQWRYDPDAPNGKTEEDFFRAFGMGVQIVRGAGDFFRERTIVGHPGEAYGLFSGAWLIKAEPGAGFPDDLTIAFAITGTEKTPGKGAHPTFNVAEEALMRLGMTAAYAGEAKAPKPFDETADARAAVDAAFAAAAADGRKVLMILGGNWCHDSRALAQHMTEPALAALIGENFHTVFVDVGRRDRNLWLPRRFDVGPLAGTPTVLIATSAGELLNRERIFDLTTADSQPIAAITDYFQSYAAPAPDGAGGHD